METFDLTKSPTRRMADSGGRITVSGGEYRATFADGRSFAHRNRALVLRLARIYARDGEAGITADMAKS